MTPGDPIAVVLGRQQVLRRDLGASLQEFGEATLPSGSGLAGLFGRFQFMVTGFDDQPDEVYAIPEVRCFYRTLLRHWPAWFYFCDLRGEGLLMMTACVLDDFQAVAPVGTDRACLVLDPAQLLAFIRSGFEPMNRMFDRVGAGGRDQGADRRDPELLRPASGRRVRGGMAGTREAGGSTATMGMNGVSATDGRLANPLQTWVHAADLPKRQTCGCEITAR